MASLSTQNLLALPKLAPALYARHGRRLPALASVLLVVIVARLLAELVWALVPTPASAVWRPAPPPTLSGAANAQIDLNAIANAALFGRYQPPADPALADLAAAPDTQLNLTLLGILANGRDPESSRALIATQGGDEKPYAIGDDLSGGTVLQAIFPDRVILSRAGRLETLRLDKDQPSSGVVPSALTEQPATDDTEAADASASLAQIRTQLLADPSKVADYIRVQPVNSGNGINGYRIYPGKDRSVFTAAGLRPGDIVTSINGVQLNDPSKSLQLLSDLSKTSQLNLIVDRGGQSQNFVVSLNP